jgi:hypothetical protein
MAGYLMRAIISYMIEVESSDPQHWAEAFQLLSGIVDWNYQYCNFCYHSTTLKPFSGRSNGTGVTFTDPQAWYGWVTGQQKYLDHLNLFLDHGIGGGERPYGKPKKWGGDFNGRAVQFSLNYSKADKIPPSKVLDLSSRLEGDEIILNWTGSLDSVRYHVIWDYKPLLSKPVFDSSR